MMRTWKRENRVTELGMVVEELGVTVAVVDIDPTGWLVEVRNGVILYLEVELTDLLITELEMHVVLISIKRTLYPPKLPLAFLNPSTWQAIVSLSSVILM